MTFSRKWIVYTSLFLIAILLNMQKFIYEQWLRFNLLNEHIVVSLSTTPHRINNIRPTLESLFKQNLNISKIYVTIPFIFKRENIEYNIPQWLLDETRVTLVRTEDYGPATKLLGILKNVDLPARSIIVTVDDDIEYPTNTILHLAYKAHKYPNSAIGISGANPIYDKDGVLSNDVVDGIMTLSRPDLKVSILQGFAGIAYRRDFFDNSIFEISKAPKECVNSDDLYISFYLAKRNITRQVLHNKYLNLFLLDTKQNIGHQADALHNLIPRPIDKHRACIAYMHANDPQVVF